jgi:hypothetical protein
LFFFESRLFSTKFFAFKADGYGFKMLLGADDKAPANQNPDDGENRKPNESAFTYRPSDTGVFNRLIGNETTGHFPYASTLNWVRRFQVRGAGLEAKSGILKLHENCLRTNPDLGLARISR